MENEQRVRQCSLISINIKQSRCKDATTQKCSCAMNPTSYDKQRHEIGIEKIRNLSLQKANA